MAYGYYYGFPEYVPVAERRKRAARKLAQLRKKGHDPKPVQIDGRAIVKTFWGKAWCDHLESHADLANRLPRGRTYVRNGSVIDLQIAEGQVRALVSGTEIYEAKVRIEPLVAARWKAVRRECAGQIGTVVELLAGKLSSAVMEVLCHRQNGLFPGTRELEMTCSCPDGAWLCKHLAAVLYGVGARFDQAPELLFTLRGVDGAKLVAAAGKAGTLASGAPADVAIGEEHLAEIFGIEMEGAAAAAVARAPKRPRRAAKKPARRRARVASGAVRVGAFTAVRRK
ncbi:MAG TPA: SWIM zinc finger family protein [Anaeromyxobacter sp.]|nr:SWIM zinc finger family protein [Anaeromyxobacter sp.]